MLDLKGQSIEVDQDTIDPEKLAAPNSSPFVHVEVDVFKLDAKIAGMDKEFVLVVVNGAVEPDYVTSAAITTPVNGSQKLTPEFQNIKLTIPRVKGVAYPWTVSNTYGDSSMFWGLQIHGG